MAFLVSRVADFNLPFPVPVRSNFIFELFLAHVSDCLVAPEMAADFCLRSRWRKAHETVRAQGRELASGGQARGQARRKFRGEDAILRGFQIVGGAVKVDDLRVSVEQREGGSPVAVARLAD